jgi:hypothetical protein
MEWALVQEISVAGVSVVAFGVAMFFVFKR